MRPSKSSRGECPEQVELRVTRRRAFDRYLSRKRISGNYFLVGSYQFPAIELPPHVPGRYWVYIMQSGDGALYVGQSNDIAERLRKHRLGIGSKHTHDHPSVVLVYSEGPFDLDTVIAREAQLKRWPRAKKEALIRADTHTLHELSRSRD